MTKLDESQNLKKLHDTFSTQNSTSRTGIAPNLQKRISMLLTIKEMLISNSEDIKKSISADFCGRSFNETEILEILPAIHALKYTIRHLKNWIKPQKQKTDIMFAPAKTYIRFEPLGVVGIISPWNYPLLLAIGPLIDAIAAGNRIMIKPSELTPHFSELLQKLIAENFADSEISVVTGGINVAIEFTHLPFDHIVFTGSTNIGKEVMRAAAENLTAVTLELGGKSPTIVAPDYPLEKAAKTIAQGKFINAGQTCIAPDYALVPKGKGGEFCRSIIQNAADFYPKLAENEQYTAVLGGKGRNRLLEAIQNATKSGAKLFQHPELAIDSVKIPPTVILNPPEDCYLMQNEIFGPILPVIEYESLEEVTVKINDRPRPLALYVFTNQKDTEDYCLNHIISGGVTINGTLLHAAQVTIPFGGIGASGIGAYHGFEGFKRLSHMRGVHKVGFINSFEKMGPPWGRLSKLIAGIFIGK